MAYPVSQLLRITQSGFFVSVRALEFLFLSVAFILAIYASNLLFSKKVGLRSLAIYTFWVTLKYISAE